MAGLVAGLVAGLAEVLEAGLLADLVAGLALERGADLAGGLAAGFAAGFAADLVAGFVDLEAVLAPAVLAAAVFVAGLRVGFKASEPMGPTGTESRRVGVRPALTFAFFLATGLRAGSAGLGAPSFKRTGLSPQISSRL